MSKAPSSAVGQLKAAYLTGTKRQREQMRAWMRETLDHNAYENAKQIVALLAGPAPKSSEDQPTKLQLNPDGTWFPLS